MYEIGALAHEESSRFGDIRSSLVIGQCEDGVFAGLPGDVGHIETGMSALDLLPDSGPIDLIVCLPLSDLGAVDARAMGLALAKAARCGVILVTQSGSEIPVPRIELKRGLIYGAPELTYRVYGRK